MASSGIGETTAFAIVAQWAAWRRQAYEEMFLSTENPAPPSLQAVSTMLDASFRRAGSVRCTLVRRIARKRKAPASALHSSSRGGVRMASLQGHVEQRDMRDRPRPCGWQARRTHVVAHELQGLSEHRAVSAFAHRHCIESFFRRRFLGVHDDGSVSMATRELEQLTQSGPVTDDQASNSSVPLGAQNNREHNSLADQVFRDDNHHLENATGNHEIHTIPPMEDQSVNVQSTVRNSNDALQDDTDQEQMNEYDDGYSDSGSPLQASEQSGSSFFTRSNNSVRQEAGTYGQQNEGEGSVFTDDGEDEQHAVDSPQWQPADELLTRRSFSELLSSGFRDILGQQLPQTQRQEFDQRQLPNSPASVEEDHAERGSNEPNQAWHETTGQPPFLFPGEARRRRQWFLNRPDFVIDAIQEVQEDVSRLYLEINNMQQMLIELQRSIKQEVSAALNRSIGDQGWAEGQRVDDVSRWNLVRKGTCCVCCDNQIDSLLYRCGHMCTCSKCARELLNGDGKCPMCRAPIVDVVQAYTT